MSSIATTTTSSSSSSSSSLAANAASTSLKRTRIIYDVHPQAAFVPSVVDSTLMELALQRRKRRPQHLQQKSNPDTMALTIANKDGSSRSVSGM